MTDWHREHQNYEPRKEWADRVPDKDTRSKIIHEATADARQAQWEERRVAFTALCERNGWG